VSTKIRFFKINFDGTFLRECKSGAWGFIVRDLEGSVVLARAGKLEKIHNALRSPNMFGSDHSSNRSRYDASSAGIRLQGID
jgi:hypothetical protein